MATCLRCQLCEFVEAVTSVLESSAGKQLNILLAVIYCYIYKSNAKKCSHNWRMGDWPGYESAPESAVLHTAKSCCIMYCCQYTWGTHTTPEGHWLLLGRRCWKSCYTLFPGTLILASYTTPLSFLKLCFNPLKTFVSYGGALWSVGCSGEHLIAWWLDWQTEMWSISCLLRVATLSHWNHTKLSRLAECLYAFWVNQTEAKDKENKCWL